MKHKKNRTRPKKEGVSGDKLGKPSNCFCGGAPVIHTGPHLVGEKPLYHVMCGACHRVLTFGETATIEFPSEQMALLAWDVMMRGTLVNG